MHKKIGVLLGLVVVWGILWYTGTIDKLNDFDTFRDIIRASGVYGYLIFIGLYTISAVFSLPAMVMTITAGVVFGPFLGGILSLVGATAGAVAAFFSSRYFFRTFLTRKFGASPIFVKIEKGVEANGIDFLILTRLLPIFPYNLQNYAYGLTSMNWLSYGLVSFITMAPGTFIYAYFAGEIAVNGVSQKMFFQLFIAGIILFFLSRLPKWIAKNKGIDI